VTVAYFFGYPVSHELQKSDGEYDRTLLRYFVFICFILNSLSLFSTFAVVGEKRNLICSDVTLVKMLFTFSDRSIIPGQFCHELEHFCLVKPTGIT